MSGIVNAFLTDDELETLVAWGEAAAESAEGIVTDHERHLLGKLRGMAQTVACRACTTCAGAEGESCSIPQQ